ncbi:hypothetical protein [Bacillus horti]|uniref:DUF4367 domain-containing protein n=1 Tax=Caldalkalibacillus horti TaxID=77523 RepID=A0ABT9VZ70_9BACI|nr:hypothetical protein [Bacillus horti]MDQ0166278.1 hypothetical protein [Bacillus horti]
MSLENQLKQELISIEKQIEIPVTLKEQVYNSIDDHLANEGKAFQRSMRKKGFSRAPVVTVIAIAIVLFSGFFIADAIERNTYKFYTNNADPIVISYADYNYDYSEEQLEKVKQIQEQLLPGEAAIIYNPDFSFEVKLSYDPELNRPASMVFSAFRKVNQLIYYTDITTWLSVLGSEFHEMKIPDRLPRGYSFEHGTIESEFYGSMGDGESEAIDKLKEKEELMAWDWVKIDNQLVRPTLTYKNSKNDRIEFSSDLVNLIEHYEMTFPETTMVESIIVNGLEMVYSIDADLGAKEHSLNRQALFWIEKQEEEYYSYRISSESQSVTKKDLILMAKHMQGVKSILD